MFEEKHRYSGIIVKSLDISNFQALKKFLDKDISDATIVFNKSNFLIQKSFFYSENACHNKEIFGDNIFPKQILGARRVYIYPIYIAEIFSHIEMTYEKSLFILAPFINILRTLISNLVEKNEIELHFIKPDIDAIIKAIQTGDELINVIKINLDASQDPDSKRVIILGENPIGSVIFKKIQDITLPISTRLMYGKQGEAKFCMTVDRFGNYFFHLNAVSQIEWLKPILDFITDKRINKSTLLNPLKRIKNEQEEE